MSAPKDNRTSVTPYDTAKALAGHLGVSLLDVIAMSRDNDPFYCGRDFEVVYAEWFADLWRRFGFGQGVHLRRIHYRLVSDGAVVMPDGAPYLNTAQCWDTLGSASRAARILGLVDPAAFVDRRAPEPKLFAKYRDEIPTPGWWMPAFDWSLPDISVKLEASLDFPQPIADGYDYDIADQRYHLVLWIEKTTMNDVLVPLCERYGMDFRTGTGFISITRVIQTLQRLRTKPVRIFYIADFDPAGEKMPVGVARQVEFWRARYAPDSEIKLTVLALTRDQVASYRLPRVPIKDSDNRKPAFEARHGEGAVELDALEALHPGELQRLVEKAIAPYFDAGLEERLTEAEDEANVEAQAAWELETEDLAAEVAAIQAEAERAVKKLAPRARALARAFEHALAPLRQRLDLARQVVAEKSENLEVALPDRPEADESDADEGDWLFDAAREYMEQMKHYHRQRDGGE